MNKTIIYIIIGLIVFGAGWFGLNYYNKQKKLNNLQKNINTTAKPAELSSKPINNSNGKLIYQVSDDEGMGIFLYDTQSNAKNLIFNDHDETLKIKKIGGLAYITQEILVWIKAEDAIGQLATIKIKDGGKYEVIADNFSQKNALDISPDGKFISYVSFSNAESDYGYSLYQMSKDGSNKRKIISSESEIKNISYNKEGNKLAYSQNIDDKFNIFIIGTAGDEASSIYKSTNPIVSISWNENEKIVFTEGLDNRLGKGAILSLDADGKNLSKISETLKDFPYSAQLSNDFNNLAFVLKTYQDNVVENLSGQLVYQKVENKKIDELGEANQIIGWIN